MASQDLPRPDFARNLKLIGYSDQGGRPDGVQVMVNRGYAFVGHMFSKGFSVIDWTAGMAVYDISNREEPRQIGFMPVEGGGMHRIWYVGGRWAYVSALLDGFTDYIFMTVDMADPTRPKEAGRYWLPGMNTAASEQAAWPPTRR
jgi:hypothetical protein